MNRCCTHPHFGTHRRAAAGMTLVEVMLAMFVLTVVFASVLTALGRANSLTHASVATYRATAVLNERMEEMRSLSFTQLQTRLAQSDFQSGSVGTTDDERNLSGVNSFAWTRTKVTAESTANLVKVVVHVTWTEGRTPRDLQTVGYFSSTGVSTTSAL